MANGNPSDEVRAALEERDRQWQSRLTPLQQQNADLRRELGASGDMASRLSAIEQSIQQNGSRSTHEQSRDVDDLLDGDWDSMTGSELRDKFRQLASNRNAPTNPDPEIARQLAEIQAEREARYRDAVDQEEREVAEKYNLDETGLQHLRQRALASGVLDLNYHASLVYGETQPTRPTQPTDPNDLTVEQVEAAQNDRRRRAAALPGGGSEPAPTRENAKIGRGKKGWRDIEHLAKQWKGVE